MFPQLEPTEATYLARLIVSILGILLFSGLAFWMIHRKQKTNSTEAIPSSTIETNSPDSFALPLAEFCPLTPAERVERSSTFEQAYQAWKAERLLQAEDSRSLFVRTGVEKSGLRYQLVASTQVQALAILLSTVMAHSDPQASTQAEALFASLLAHPAYGQSQLSSWTYLPDLPRSPKLDPNPHAEAWLIYALLSATRRWPSLNRFNYSEIIPERTQALSNYINTLDPELSGPLPFCRFLVNQLKAVKPSLEWSALGESQELYLSRLKEPGFFTSEIDTSQLGLSLLQLGMLALLDRDPVALLAIRKVQSALIQLVEYCQNNASTETEFNRTAMLSCTIPAVLTLQDNELNYKIWNSLTTMQPDKNDGLGATLKLLAMAFLANQPI